MGSLQKFNFTPPLGVVKILVLTGWNLPALQAGPRLIYNRHDFLENISESKSLIKPLLNPFCFS